MKPELIASLLQSALEQPLGVYVECNNAPKTAQALDDLKKFREEFAGLMVCIVDIPDTVFIIHKSVELDP